MVTGIIQPFAFASYTIDPLRIEVTVPDGSNVATTSVSVQNLDDDPIRLKAYLQNWSQDEAGNVTLLDTPGPNDIAEKVRFNPREFEIPGKSTQIVRLAISLPDNASAGEYRGMLFFEDLKTESQLLKTAKGYGASVQIKQRFGISMYVYKGAPTPEPKLVSFNCSAINGKLVASIELLNQGNKHARLNAGLVLMQKDNAGNLKPFKEVPINEYRDIVVLPNNKRKVEQLIGPSENLIELPHGQYIVRLNVDSKEDDSIKDMDQSQTVDW